MLDEELIRSPEFAAPPTLRELAMVLFRQRKVFVCVASLVLLAAVIYATVGTKYEASMKVLVRRGRTNAPVTAQADAPPDLARMVVTEEELNTEAELLRDDEVLRQVVEETGSVGRGWLPFLHFGEGKEERIARATRRLSEKLRVAPVKKTNLIAIRYAADNPRTAAKVLQSLEKAYLKKHMAVHRPGAYWFFERQREESRSQLDESERRLASFAADHGVVAAGEERDLALHKLSELDVNYRQTRVDLNEMQQRVWELEAQLQRLPQRTTTLVRTADNAELFKTLKSSLLDLRLKRTGLLTKFEPSHRLVQEIDQQIAQAESEIASERTLPLRDETTDRSAQYEWAESELQKTQVQLRGLQAREAEIAKQKSTCQALAAKLGKDAITQDDLLNSERAALENYSLYVKKQEAARMDDALDQQGIVNVAITEHPVTPVLPVWSVWTVLAIGIVLAGTTGTASAFVADYMDPAFRNPEDVVMYLHSPVLASLPRTTQERFLA